MPKGKKKRTKPRPSPLRHNIAPKPINAEKKAKRYCKKF